MESVYGRDVSEMLATLSYQGLVDEVDAIMDLNPDDTHLKLHLQNRDPDDGLTAIAYDKGYFLRRIEEVVGREAFDSFLKTYFATHAFSVMDTDRFIDYLKSVLLTSDELLAAVELDAWIFGPGLPDNCPTVSSARIERVDAALAGWEAGTTATSDLPWNEWVYQERYRFLSNLNDATAPERQRNSTRVGHFTTGNNSFVRVARAEHPKPIPTIVCTVGNVLVEIGRRKFLTPLYKAMVDTDQKAMADAIYTKARPTTTAYPRAPWMNCSHGASDLET